jgi:hypothetical protein
MTKRRCMQDVVGCGDNAKMVSKLVEKVGVLESTMLESERIRRGLHNELVELRGNIRVFARIRPTDKVPVAEATSGTSMRLLVDAKPNDFQFDRCVARVAEHTLDVLNMVPLGPESGGSNATNPITYDHLLGIKHRARFSCRPQPQVV